MAAAAAATILVTAIGVSAWLAPAPDLELNFTDISNTHRVRAAQDGAPTGVRIVQIAPFTTVAGE